MKKLSLLLCGSLLAIGVAASAGPVVAANATETPQEQLEALIAKYIGTEGKYTKKTTIGLNDASVTEMAECFHANQTAKERTTYYAADKLILADVDGTIPVGSGSYYLKDGYIRRSANTEKVTIDAEIWNHLDEGYVAYPEAATKLEDKFVSLKTFQAENYFSAWAGDATNGYHLDINEVGKAEDKGQTWKDFLYFCAPMLYTTSGTYFSAKDLTVKEKVDADSTQYLELTLHLADVDSGKLDDHGYLAQARVYQGNHIFEENLIVQLAAPSISINANVVSWSAVANADSYDVYVNNAVVANVTTTNYTISDLGNHDIEVVAKSSLAKYSDSDKSNTITFNSSAQQLWLAGSSAAITSGAEISGLNYGPSADSPLSPNQVVKIGYAMTVRNIATSGTIDFKPLIQRNVEGVFVTIGETEVSYSYSDLYKIGGNILVSFVIQLPSDFNKTTDYVVPRLWCNGEIDATLAGIFMHTNGYDYKDLTSWPFAGEAVATTKTMAVTNGYMPSTAPAPYVPDSTIYWSTTSSASITSGGSIEGLNCPPSATNPLRANQVVKVCYCVNITSIDATGTITFYPLQQRLSQGYATTGDTTVTANYSDMQKIGGKIVISFVVQLSSAYDPTDDYIVPRLKFDGAVQGQLEWIYIMGDGYDCGNFPDYAYGLEVRATSSTMAVTNRYKPSTAPAPYVPDSTIYWSTTSSASITSGGSIEGLNCPPSATNPLRANQVVKVCYCVNITSIDATGTITFYPLQQRLSQGYATTGYTTIVANYSDLVNTSGQIVLSFVVQLSSIYDPTDDYIVPRLKFEGAVQGQLEWIYIMGDAYNCGTFPGYAFGLEAKATSDTMAVTNKYTPSVVA